MTEGALAGSTLSTVLLLALARAVPVARFDDERGGVSVALAVAFSLQALAGTGLGRNPAIRADDSARVRRHARDAQAAFEARRVSLLPIEYGGGDACEQRIGRMCYSWDGHAEPQPPPEPSRIGVLRATLIERLEADAERIPGDEWIVGQLVRYLIEAERTADAQRVARTTCQAAFWWCEALAGWAAHEGERYADAEVAYARALAAMPVRERCRWEDVSEILDPARAAKYRRLDCEARRAEQSRLMWLARPLLTASGNDLLTEHYARLTYAQVLRASRSPHGMPWGDDLRQLMVRYGWSTSWTRSPGSPYAGVPRVAGRSRPVSLNFFPSEQALDQPGRLSDSSWRFSERHARTRYAPRWTTDVTTPAHQIASFVRGDSMVVLAAFDVSRDTAFADSLDAALALAPRLPGPITVVRARSARRGRLIAGATQQAASLASLELLDRRRRAAARVRTAIGGDRAERMLSDLTLIEPGPITAGPATLREVSARMLAGTETGTGTKVGVYWELYEVAPGDTVGNVSLTLRRQRAGAFRRAAEAIGILGRTLPVSLAWQDRTEPASRVLQRSVVLDLVGVPAGRYMLDLEVRLRGRALRASRSITVTP